MCKSGDNKSRLFQISCYLACNIKCIYSMWVSSVEVTPRTCNKSHREMKWLLLHWIQSWLSEEIFPTVNMTDMRSHAQKNKTKQKVHFLRSLAAVFAFVLCVNFWLNVTNDDRECPDEMTVTFECLNNMLMMHHKGCVDFLILFLNWSCAVG